MSLLSKKALVLLLAAATGLGALNAQAAKATSSDAPAHKVSMLGGKFTFNLPKGFVANPLPASPDGASGTMYSNETTKTVVIAAENTLPNGVSVKDNDGGFLDGTVADFDAAQRKALPDFNKLSEKSLTQKDRAGPAPDRRHCHAGRWHDPQHHADGRVRHSHGGDPGDFPPRRHGGPRNPGQTDRQRKIMSGVETLQPGAQILYFVGADAVTDTRVGVKLGLE